MTGGRLMEFRCGACGTVHHIPRALALDCPACQAAPGQRCRDLRSSTLKHRLTPHPEREALLP
jgi:uncharacterized OB-fold protein